MLIIHPALKFDILKMEQTFEMAYKENKRFFTYLPLIRMGKKRASSNTLEDRMSCGNRSIWSSRSFCRRILTYRGFRRKCFLCGMGTTNFMHYTLYWKASFQGKGLAHFGGYNHVGHHYMACGAIHNDDRLEQVGIIIITLMVNLKHSITL
jgi:hypothetical protein